MKICDHCKKQTKELINKWTTYDRTGNDNEEIQECCPECAVEFEVLVKKINDELGVEFKKRYRILSETWFGI